MATNSVWCIFVCNVCNVCNMDWVLDFPIKGAVEFRSCEDMVKNTTRNE